MRRAAGLTQRELAQRADCSLAFIGNLEAGCLPKKSPTLRRVLGALDEALTKTKSERPDATPDAREDGEAAPHGAA